MGIYRSGGKYVGKKIYWEISKHARCPKCESYLAYIPIHNSTDIKFFCPHCDYVETSGGKHIDLPGKKLEKRTVTFEEVKKQQSNPSSIWIGVCFILIVLLFIVSN